MRLEVPVPEGYIRLVERRAVIIARADVAAAVRAMFGNAPSGHPTLHGYASRVASARAMHGRDTAYAIRLPEAGISVVVRHNRHGGALRALTGDLFLGATRAPLELAVALRLHSLGVLTPAVVAYAIYRAGVGLSRSDVVTEEVSSGTDFGALLLATNPDSEERRMGWQAVGSLLKSLAAAGVRHHDLNVKNVLLQPLSDHFSSWLLDVDRVQLDCPVRQADAGNRARLARSLAKWRDTRGAAVTDVELDAVRRTASSTP